MKRTICPRCGSSNIDWIIPQVKEKYLEEENMRAQQIASGEDEVLDDEMELEEEDELSEEELDKKLRELNL